MQGRQKPCFEMDALEPSVAEVHGRVTATQRCKKEGCRDDFPYKNEILGPSSAWYFDGLTPVQCNRLHLPFRSGFPLVSRF